MDGGIQDFKWLYKRHEVEFLRIGIFISKAIVLLYVTGYFKLNIEINFTTQDSQGVYVFDISMAFFYDLFEIGRASCRERVSSPV